MARITRKCRVFVGLAGSLAVLLGGLPALHAIDNGSAEAKSSVMSRPNVILFLVDDMGWQDTSVPFHSKPTALNRLYRTPHMERLAARGIRLTNAYAASPVCSPTRASMMTGMNPGRTKISDWVRGGGGRAGNHNSVMLSAPWNSDGIQPDEFKTLPHVLQSAGYLTAHVGKAHFGARGSQGGHDPINLGFEINIAGSEAGSPNSYFSPWINAPRRYPHLKDHPKGEYMTQALTFECNRIVDRAVKEQRPFFINCAHYAIHTPIAGQGDPKYLPNYQDNRPTVERDYAAMIESMDASLGSIMDHLREIGIDESTLIVFTSDNGGLSNHTRADTVDKNDVWRRDWHNFPLSSGKGSAYEGGIRVPMIVAWAGQEPGAEYCNEEIKINPGSTSHSPVHTDDLFPTILAAANVENSVQADNLDGQDLSPVFQGTPFRRKQPLVWHYPHQWYRDLDVGPGIRPFTAIRHGRLKLIYFYSPDGGELELYDLDDDLSEQNDLSQSVDHQDDIRRMGRMLRGWMKRVDAQVPIDRKTGNTISLANLPDGP